MGCSSSSQVSTLAQSDRESSDTINSFSQHHWRQKLSRQQSKLAYIKDGTLPKDADANLLTLRAYLEDPASLCQFAEYCKKQGKLNLLYFGLIF